MTYYDISTIRALTGLTTSEVADATLDTLGALADSEVDQITKQAYSSTQTTEYYSMYPPKQADEIVGNRLILKHYPVLSIDSFLLLDSSGTTTSTLSGMTAATISGKTYQNTTYFIDPTIGLVELTTQTFDFVPSRAKIQYTYGYTSVPVVVKELSSCLTGIRAWVNFLGGNYDRLNSYSLPEQSYNKGDFYDRGMQIIKILREQSDNLLNQLGRKQRSQIFFTSGGSF